MHTNVPGVVSIPPRNVHVLRISRGNECDILLGECGMDSRGRRYILGNIATPTPTTVSSRDELIDSPLVVVIVYPVICRYPECQGSKPGFIADRMTVVTDDPIPLTAKCSVSHAAIHESICYTSLGIDIEN